VQNYLVVSVRESAELSANSQLAFLGVRPLTTNEDEDDEQKRYGNNCRSHAAADDQVTVHCVPVSATCIVAVMTGTPIGTVVWLVYSCPASSTELRAEKTDLVSD